MVILCHSLYCLLVIVRIQPLGKWYCPPCGARNNGTTSTSAVDEGVLEEYCVCGRGYVGKMVGCDNANCLVEWFHFECVNLTAEVRLVWLCIHRIPSYPGQDYSVAYSVVLFLCFF